MYYNVETILKCSFSSVNKMHVSPDFKLCAGAMGARVDGHLLYYTSNLPEETSRAAGEESDMELTEILKVQKKFCTETAGEL